MAVVQARQSYALLILAVHREAVICLAAHRAVGDKAQRSLPRVEAAQRLYAGLLAEKAAHRQSALLWVEKAAHQQSTALWAEKAAHRLSAALWAEMAAYGLFAALSTEAGHRLFAAPSAVEAAHGRCSAVPSAGEAARRRSAVPSAVETAPEKRSACLRSMPSNGESTGPELLDRQSSASSVHQCPNRWRRRRRRSAPTSVPLPSERLTRV